MEFNKGNLTTIAVFIYMLISPILSEYGVLIDESTFTTGLIGIIGLIIAIKSAKHPHNLDIFKNKNNETNINNNDTC